MSIIGNTAVAQLAGTSVLPALPVKNAAPAAQEFSTVLAGVRAVDELRFSAHAQNRLKSRQIEVTPQIMESLKNAVDGAAKKGSNNSLILLSDLAFIVNVPNRTVVTAMDGNSVKDNIFTNIDSTVIAGR